MTFDAVDMVWSAMADDEFYSPNDLANMLEQPLDTVTRVLEFLEKYEFAEQITRHEMIFRKVANGHSQVDALKVLQMVLGGYVVDDVDRIASVSKIDRRQNASP